jgi:hypothetical protein
MTTKTLSYFVITTFLMVACLAEQDNPLVEMPSCYDGIKNQNEGDVDCGGICTQCNNTPPVVVPCKASLADNVITLDGNKVTFSESEVIDTKKTGFYEIFIVKNSIEYLIEINADDLPKKTTIYPLEDRYDAGPDQASITIINFYVYSSINEGDLYVSYKDGKWLIELCSVNLYGQVHTYEMTGRFVCDWK